jgi:hypothetical protein
MVSGGESRKNKGKEKTGVREFAAFDARRRAAARKSGPAIPPALPVNKP